MSRQKNKKEWMDIFADRLSELIRKKGYSQEEFARACGLSQGTVSKYINKQQLPGLKAIVSMSKVLEMSVDEITNLGGKN